MLVKLVSKTEPEPWLKARGIVTLLDLISYEARVSNPGNEMNTATGPKLIKYLIKSQHWSPLEMADMTVEVRTTRDIARQMLRHRSFSFQEFSQRYAEVEEPLEFREARLQDKKNRQNSIENEDEQLAHLWEFYQREVAKQSERAYRWALDNGIAKEQARAVIPDGMAPTRIYMKGSIRSWIHYVGLRSAEGTQKEHREIAIECGKLLGDLGIEI